GKNVYATAADRSLLSGRQLDVLSRNAANGALSSSGCLEYEEPPRPKEEEEEGEEEAESARASGADNHCQGVAGLNSAGVVEVSGDGSAVYVIGNGSAAIFSRNAATGALSEVSCAADEDSRCTPMPSLEGVTGAAISPDGRQVYVAASGSDAVMAFGIGAAVTTASASASHAGLARVSVACPAGLRRACRGNVALTRAVARSSSRHGHRHINVRRLRAGGSGAFAIAPGQHSTVSVRLTQSARSMLRRHRRLRLMAVVHARPSSGGSGYGRHLSLRVA
ncbi:MAG: hypothetical protein ACYDHT_11950, partial [Solirubrobacteraceae bacterium]